MLNTILLLYAAGGPVKRNAELFFPAEFADDFPVSLQVSKQSLCWQPALVCKRLGVSLWQKSKVIVAGACE